MVKYNLVEQKPKLSSSVNQKPALGVIEAVSAGFEAVLRHPWLLLIPLALDLFLWIGPRLEAPALYQNFEPTLRQMSADMSDANARLAAQELGNLLKDFFAHYNLFSALSVTLVGVPVLNAGIHLASARFAWQIDRFSAYLIAVAVGSFVGLLLSGLYWAMLAGQVRGERWAVRPWLRDGWAVALQLLLLMLSLLAVVFMSIFPLSMVMLTVAAFSPGLASLVPALGMALLVWLIVMALFVPHGLALYRIPLAQALRLSVLVVRLYFWPTLGLIAVAVSLSLGMGLIWDGIPFESPLRLLAMAGNAIVGTGLLLASLLYYQNRAVILCEQFHWPLPGQQARPTVNHK